MRTAKTRALPAPPAPARPVSTREHLRRLVGGRLEEIMAQIAPTIRRFRTFLLVATICLPLLVIGFIAVLWHMAG